MDPQQPVNKLRPGASSWRRLRQEWKHAKLMAAVAELAKDKEKEALFGLMEKKENQFVMLGGYIINVQAIAFIERHGGGLTIVFSARSDNHRLSLTLADPLAQSLLDYLEPIVFGG